MTPSREARELRDIAAEIEAIGERVESLLNLHPSDDNEDMLERLATTLAVEASDLRGRAETMNPTPWTPTLFQWMRGKTVPAVRQ